MKKREREYLRNKKACRFMDRVYKKMRDRMRSDFFNYIIFGQDPPPLTDEEKTELIK